MNIVFGTKRLTQTAVRNASTEKYNDLAVITVEGLKGAKKSRRILMNRMASELLNLEAGDVQELIFAPVQDTNQVLIANMATIDGESGDMTSYKTSKNKVSYTESTEKGKAITSSHMCREIFSFMGKDETTDVEFMLTPFNTPSIDAFSLDIVSYDTTTGGDSTTGNITESNTTDTLTEVTVTAEPVLDTVELDEVLVDEINVVDSVEVTEAPQQPQGLRRATAVVTEEWAG